MKKHFCPHLVLMAAALALALVWDMGYSAFSLETLACLAAGLGIGALMGLICARWPRLRAVFLVFLFLCLLDVFFLRTTWMAWTAFAVGLPLAAIFHDKVPATALVVSSLAFAVLVLMQVPRSHAQNVVLPAVEDDTAFVVHLMFDELGGLDAIPKAHRRQQDIDDILAGYAARGLTVYDEVSSLTPDTYKSMGMVLDNRFIENPDDNVTKLDGEDRYRIVHNTLQQRIAHDGWHVSIVQSWYLDYCRPEFSCVTYLLTGSSGVFENLPDWRLRLQVLGRELHAALMSDKRGMVLVDMVRPAVFEYLVLRSHWRNPTLPFVAMQQLDLLQEGLVRGSGRQYVYAHLLLPHFPWVFDGHCRAKDFADWRLPYLARYRTSPQAREEAYTAYQDQALCMHRKVFALIDAVDAAHPGKVRFVIHGDHGPRILLREIPAEGVDSLDAHVRRNLLSTFVAARVGDDVPASPTRTDVSLQRLIPELLMRALEGEAIPDTSSGP